MNTTLSAESVSEFVSKIIEFPNFHFARGESKAYDHPFLPSIWRPDNDHLDRSPISVNSNYTQGEWEVLLDFQQKVIRGDVKDPYFPTFIGDIKSKININSESIWHWTSLAQHYRTPTRLVDVTSDSLIALYFACEQNSDDDGFVHVFKDNFNLVGRNNLSLVEFGDNYFNIGTIKDFVGDNHPRQPQDNTTSVIIPSFPNRRVEVQKGAFCVTRGIMQQAYWGGQLTYRIPAKKKGDILEELEKLGYKEQTIYPPEY